jgi:hypothetical protein
MATAQAERFAIVSRLAAAQFHRLPVAVRDILRLCDGTRTLESICACADLPSDRTKHVLHRLTELGVISAITTPPPRRRRLTPVARSWVSGETPPKGVEPAPAAQPAPAAKPAPVAKLAPVAQPAPIAKASPAAIPGDFSDDEERFFSSSIEHLLEDTAWK